MCQARPLISIKEPLIFARHVEKDLWNNAYIEQIETKYWDKGLEAVDVHGFNPVQRDSNKSSADTTRATDLQAPRILKLRTCADRRMRVVMLHSEDISRRWCNGTPCRLLAKGSWPGPSGSIRQNLDELRRNPNGGASGHTAISRIQRLSYRR